MKFIQVVRGTDLILCKNISGDKSIGWYLTFRTVFAGESTLINP